MCVGGGVRKGKNMHPCKNKDISIILNPESDLKGMFENRACDDVNLKFGRQSL